MGLIVFIATTYLLATTIYHKVLTV